MSPEEKKLLQETHDAVVRLETSWNGGPGHWPVCVEHTGLSADHEKRIRYAEKRINMALGGVALIGLAGTVIGIVVAAKNLL